ncbi:MAG: hypothetical protein AAFP13_09935 [Pseudomonadota bacterium]
MKPFSALILSGVLAVTSLTPAPARAADGEDLAKLLLGALVLYGIADAVQDNRRKETARKAPAPQQKAVEPAPRLRHGGVITPAGPRGHRQHHGGARRAFLPVSCILHHQRWDGTHRTVFGNQCLRKNYRHYASLPQNCYRRFDTVRGNRVGWGPRCLRRAGYTW